MNVKISKFVNLKILAVALAVIIAIMPFFQPKKVQASPLLLGITALLTTGMIAGRYVQTNVLYTPEQMNQINEKWTANLQTAFPDPKDYNDQMNVLQNLNQKLLNGEEVDWSKYSGKALYAVLKGVVDVVWPYTYTFTNRTVGFVDGWRVEHGFDYPYTHSSFARSSFTIADDRMYSFVFKNGAEPRPNYYRTGSFYVWDPDGISKLYNSTYFVSKTEPYYTVTFSTSCYPELDQHAKVLCAVYGIPVSGSTLNAQLVSNITAKTANKVKLPTRLPQTVINNINNYYNGETENLTIAPTPEELPTLPDGYNPNTDELPDIPGYQDVTPDQEPTDTPDPTPTPVEPTPTPEGEYNGDRWVNPIGDFFDGLLKFMKAAFIPTLSLNLDALSAVPDNLGEKFPFSLPSDIIGMVTLFQAEPVPIEISFNIPTHIFGYQDIPIKGDTSFMDDYMPAIRNLIFLIFLFSLAWSTFNMFFGGGDD
ncbi:hypothetical protein [Eubacterium sp. 1001713B170207_170306_E7]|uniref:hypothetical protein n=1 Tax=Eubacterium sp. 1001713B170207_170306_E7 TaxID=2787097 RepID=UPI001896D737|nr:hypothetical protein [Eubacterium sp. 1001713B170207_170306_E7]